MNLEPSTRYRVRVQLSRPGEGGEGDPGPEAIMETDCPGKTHRQPFKLDGNVHLLSMSVFIRKSCLVGNIYCLNVWAAL